MESFKQWEHLYVNISTKQNKNKKTKKESSDNYTTLLIDALNETNPGMHITEDAILQIELGFRKMRELFQCKKKQKKKKILICLFDMLFTRFLHSYTSIL